MILRPKPKYGAINAWWFHWRTQNQFISKYEYWIDFYWHEVLQMHYNELRMYRIELLQLIIYSAFIMKVFVEMATTIHSISTSLRAFIIFRDLEFALERTKNMLHFPHNSNLSIKIKWYVCDKYNSVILLLMKSFLKKLINSPFSDRSSRLCIKVRNWLEIMNEKMKFG